MQNRHNFDRVRASPIKYAVRRLDQFTDLRALVLRNHAARLGKLPRLRKPMHDPIDDLLGVHRRGRGDVLRNRTKLSDCLLRPAEQARHDARRIRARTRASASS